MKTEIFRCDTSQKKSSLLMTLLFLYLSAFPQPMHSQLSEEHKNVFLAMMNAMMAAIDTAPRHHDVAADFMEQMIPHHACAVAMARYEIEYGKNRDMVQLAKSILVEQENEITQMRLWLRNSLVTTATYSTDFMQALQQSMNVMMEHMPTAVLLTDTDGSFAMVMLPHHRAAVDMAKALVKFSNDQQALAFAKHIISEQQVEIDQMKLFLK